MSIQSYTDDLLNLVKRAAKASNPVVVLQQISLQCLLKLTQVVTDHCE